MNEPYELLPEDAEYLDAHYSSKWRKVTEGGSKHGLIIDCFSVPDGYTASEPTMMILVPSGYPGAALDMFYFSPQLDRLDGMPIEALASETHFGETWQRWSRHYDWKPGEDSIVSHIEFVRNHLHQEIA